MTGSFTFLVPANSGILAGATDPTSLLLHDDVLGSKLMATLTMRLSGVVVVPVAETICCIAGLSVPAEIIQTVIERVVIPMTSNHSEWAFTNESLKHKMMNQVVFHRMLATFVKVNERIRAVEHRLQQASSPHSSGSLMREAVNATGIGDFVKTFIAWHRQPAFNVEHASILSSKGQS